MKKLLSLVLCLMLALSCVLAETSTTTVDFGTFTMELGPNDQYEVASSKTDGQLYAIIYPDYDPNALFTKSINAVWTATDLAAEVKMIGGMDKYAELVLKNAESQYSAMGITMTSATVLGTDMDNETAASIATYTLDYTGAGVDMVTDLYQMQALFFNSKEDNYLFTLTALTLDELLAMSAYLDTLVFTNNAQPVTSTVDFGYFTMDLRENDAYEIAEERKHSATYATIDPAHSTTDIFVGWFDTNYNAQVELFGADHYAQSILQEYKAAYEGKGFITADAQVQSASYENGVFTLLCSLDLAPNEKMAATRMYNLEHRYLRGEDGIFAFAVTAPSMEQIEEVAFYLDTVVFKEAAPTTVEVTTVDFGAFTMEVSANDYYEVADAMTSNAVYLMLYPNYYITGQTTNNINVVYTEDNLSLQLLLVGGIEKYAELMLQQAAPQYEALGIKMSNAQVLFTAHEDNEAAIIISSDLDYSGAGVDLTLTLYQMTTMFMDTPSGDFICTCTATSLEELQTMMSYVESLQF